MTQSGFPWDGTTLGQAAAGAWTAPYSSLEYSDIYHRLLGSLNPYALVIPSLNNKLVVTANSPAAMNVLAKSGDAFVAGKLYENSATETLTITTADATNPRIDRVVIRITYATQLIELAVLAGTPAATPALPTLTQNSTTWEVSLAYIWVAATATSIADTDIHDERIFASNLWEGQLHTFDNLIQNSEFMAFSRLDNVLGTSPGVVDRWNLVGTVTTFASATKPSQMSRGRAVQITAGAGSSGMSQTFKVRASSVFYTIKVLVNVTAGDNAEIVVTTDSASANTIRRYVKRTGSWIEEIIYYPTESDATTMTVSLLARNNTDVVQYGQCLVMEGYIAGPFRQIHETIFFDYNIDDTLSSTTKSTSTVTIDFDTDFQGLILPGTRAVYIYSSAVDTGASGSIAFRSKGSTVSIFSVFSTGGLAAFGAGFVPIDVNNQVDFKYTASGAGTLTVFPAIVGIVI